MSKISDLLKDIDLLVLKYSNINKLEEENKVLKIKLEWSRHCFKRALEMMENDNRQYLEEMYLYYFIE